MGAAIVLFGLAIQPAFSQGSEDKIHIVPRSTPHDIGDRRPLQANVDVVLVDVTVADAHDEVVTDLSAGDFTLLDNKRPQTIRYFSREDSPLSLAIVLDTSGSMKGSMAEARRAAVEVFRLSNRQDEIALITFAERPLLLADFIDATTDVEPALQLSQPKGNTALWDAMYFAISKLRGARYKRRALLIISDGGDNQSRYTQGELESVLKEADVQVHAIDILEGHASTIEERAGFLALDKVTRVTGGRAYLTHDVTELDLAVAHISTELRHQYVLGYSPERPLRDGKWHKITVGVNVAKSRRLHVYSKRGYRGPVD
jgi:Ca-activated chloride channel family protein